MVTFHRLVYEKTQFFDWKMIPRPTSGAGAGPDFDGVSQDGITKSIMVSMGFNTNMIEHGGKLYIKGGEHVGKLYKNRKKSGDLIKEHVGFTMNKCGT